MPATCKSSMPTRAWFLQREVVSLWAASLRMLATRVCCFASLRQVFLRFLPPFLRLDFCRSKRRSLFCAWFNARGFAKLFPSEQVASILMPRSTPIAVVAVGTGFSCSSSTWIETNQCPACSETVAESTFASVGMKSCSWIRKHPRRGNCTPSEKTLIEPVSRKEPMALLFFFSLGKPSLPFHLPAFASSTRRKKFLYALSRSLSASCIAHLETSYTQGKSVGLRTFNCLCKSRAVGRLPVVR